MTGLEGRQVLVTGGSGFLGRVVEAELRRVGADRVVAVGSGDYDLRRLNDIDSMLRDVRPDLVIHLAAVVGGIGANQENPGRFFYENAIMGIQLIEQARIAGVSKFVTIGTVCSYPKYTQVPFQEGALWDGYPEETNAPYGLAKKMLLVQSQAYRSQYGMNATYLIPVNLYGPGDNFDPSTSHVIPALIRKAVAARDAGSDHIVIWGSGSPSREFLYVEDAARGIVLASIHYDGPEPINLGTGREISIKQLAELIVQMTGFKGEIRWERSKPDGQPRRALDTTRAKELFGFEAATPLEQGLEHTIAWYEQQSASRFN